MSEPATVAIQGAPAAVGTDNTFRASVPVGAGTNVLTIAATDPSSNATTRQYEVDSAGASRTFTYDATENLTADGTRTFEWNARNQLVAVNLGTHRSEFTYDGEKPRVRIVEKENSIVQTDARVIWCRTIICEEPEMLSAVQPSGQHTQQQTAG